MKRQPMMPGSLVSTFMVRRFVEGGTALFLAACLTPPPPPPRSPEPSASSPATHPADFSAALKNKSRATLELVDIHPRPGATVDTDTEIHAQLRYTLELHPDTVYRVTAQFDTNQPGRSFSVNFGSSITTTAGELEIRLSMKDVYRNPNVGRPIRLRFFLLQSVTPTTSFAVAMSEYVEYQSVVLVVRPREPSTLGAGLGARPSHEM